MGSVGLDQGKAYRHQDPAFDGKSAVAGRHKAPSRPNGLQRSVIERLEPRRLLNFGALYRTVSADQHADRHGALLRASPRDGRVRGGRISRVIGVSDRIWIAAVAATAVTVPSAVDPTCRRSAAWSRGGADGAVGRTGGRMRTSRVTR